MRGRKALCRGSFSNPWEVDQGIFASLMHCGRQFMLMTIDRFRTGPKSIDVDRPVSKTDVSVLDAILFPD